MRYALIKEKGLTLIEILISLGISATVGGLLLVIITNSTGIFYKESSKIQSGLNINDVLVELKENVKLSNSVVAVYSSGLTTYTSGQTQLVLKLSSIDSSNNIIPNVFDYFVFFLDQNKLRLKTFPNILSSRKAQDRIFSTSVNSLVFQYLNSANPSIEVVPSSATKIRMTLILKQKSGADYDVNIATAEANIVNN